MAEGAGSSDLPGGIGVWAQYAKERYDAEEKRLTDFRNWARQLAAAVGVVVGLEAALLSQIIRIESLPVCGLTMGLFLLLLNVGYQIGIMALAARCGYIGQQALGPESPSVLSEYPDHLRDEPTARRTVGSYYAMGVDNLHKTAEDVVRRVRRLALNFIVSLGVLFVVMVVTAGLALVPLYGRKDMADKPTSSQETPATSSPAAPAANPATPAVSPTPAPLMSTPTPGRVETREAPRVVEKIVSTPTRGQLTTSNENKSKK